MSFLINPFPVFLAVLEIRIRNWLIVFLKIGYFIGYWLLSQWKCTGYLADQNRFWSAKFWNWSENDQWLTGILALPCIWFATIFSRFFVYFAVTDKNSFVFLLNYVLLNVLFMTRCHASSSRVQVWCTAVCGGDQLLSTENIHVWGRAYKICHRQV